MYLKYYLPCYSQIGKVRTESNLAGVTDNYMFKVNNGNSRTKCEIC